MFRHAKSNRAKSGRICISGTGRAGTTFLVELFTALGFDTGADRAEYYPMARAGLEFSIFSSRAPRVLKSPLLCDQVDAALEAGVIIDHVIIPIRRFDHAAASRIHVQKISTGQSDGRSVAGGLWATETASEQEAVLRSKLASLIEALVRNDIPMTLLAFPRSATDASYAYGKLAPLMPDITPEVFHAAFEQTAKPELIGNFA